jgi:hypothetical protein
MWFQSGLKVFLSDSIICLSILPDSSRGLKYFWVFPFWVFPFYLIPVWAKSLSKWFYSMSFHSTWFQLELNVFLSLSILSLSILRDSSWSKNHFLRDSILCLSIDPYDTLYDQWTWMPWMTTWFDMIQPDLTWFNKIWHDSTWFDMIWHDLTWMTWFDMNDMIWHKWHYWTQITQMTWIQWSDINYMIWHDLTATEQMTNIKMALKWRPKAR